MKSQSAVIIVLALNFALVSAECRAQASSGKDWEVLFNGKDLSGWQIVNGQHKAEVKDGIIVGTTVEGQPNGFLCTTKEYGDFILEVEVKTDVLLDNSGVQFRSVRDEKTGGRLHGYQAQIENRPPHVSQWNGGIAQEGTGWLYIIEDDPKRQKAYVQNQWNKFRVEAIGTTNRVWVNGVPTAHLVDSQYNKGFVCLQFHSSGHSGEHIYMRDVRIQAKNVRPSPYDDTPVVNTIANNISPQEEHQGFQLIFDGKTTRGWRGVDQSGLPASGWAIKDGMLTITSDEGEMNEGKPVMMTDKLYGPFELKFDFRILTEGAVVGVDYYYDSKPKSKFTALYGQRANRMRRRLWREELLFQKVSPEVVWNQGVIRATKDNRVEYWLNGYKIMEYKRDAEAPSKGHIVLGAHGGSISYQSVKIRELR